MTSGTDNDWWPSLLEAIAAGKRITATPAEYDAACGHIVGLLRDASQLLRAGSIGTASFLAITALEEIAKVRVDLFRHSPMDTPRHKDPLYSHRAKHRLAAPPSVAMGSRLRKAIGETRMDELIRMARDGRLGGLPEASLYVERQSDRLRTPGDAVDAATARDLLLFAIEAFDDAAVGWTSRTNELGAETDALFAEWAPSHTG